MPGHDHSGIAANLKNAFLPPDTPCAIISRATTKQQKLFYTTVGALAEAPRLPSPTLLVVGEVVRKSDARISELASPASDDLYVSSTLVTDLNPQAVSIGQEPVA
jgi:siroheme synthase